MVKKILSAPFFIHTIVIAGIAGVTALAYWGIQHHQFLNFDDDMYLMSNEFIKNGISLENIKWALSFNGEGYWHPLTWLSLMLDCHIFGLNPAPMLVENVIFHFFNALFIYLILFKLTGARLKAALVAVLFAVHPLNVESVAWMVERKTVLSVFFLLSALYSYLFYVQRKSKWLYAAVIVLYALGLTAKPIIMVFPLLLLVIDYWPLDRFKLANASSFEISAFIRHPFRNFSSLYKSDIGVLVWEKLPFLFLSFMSLLVSMVSLYQFDVVINHQLIPYPLRIANAFVSIVLYLKNIAWPVELSIFYPFPKTIPWWQTLSSFFIVTGVTAAFFMARKNRPWLWAGWCWFMITFLPASGLLQSGLWPQIANRFMYLPMTGLFIALIWEADHRLKGRYDIFLKTVLCVCLISYFTFLTRIQNVYFSNSFSLFYRSLEVIPDNALALNNIGVHLSSLGRYDEAMKYLERGIKLYPKSSSYYQNYAVCLVSKGDDYNAVMNFKKALALDPNLYGSYLNLGLIQSRRGYTDEALRLLEKAMTLKPDNPVVRRNYAIVLSKKGRTGEAVSHFAYVVKRNPSDIEARLNLAQAYQELHRFDDAMREYQYLDQNVKTNKGYIYYGMAGIFSEREQYRECLAYLEMAQKNNFEIMSILKKDKRFRKFMGSQYYPTLLESLGLPAANDQ